MDTNPTEQEVLEAWGMTEAVDYDDPRLVRTEAQCWELIEAAEAAERARNQTA